MTKTRIITHADHEDIETLFPHEAGEVWAVTQCNVKLETKEDEMNTGWYPTIPLKTRLENLAEQIPTEYRNRAVAECTPSDGNPHDLERNLTGYVLRREWECYASPIDEAEFSDAWSDERLDNGLTDDVPYRPAKKGEDFPF